MRIHKTNGRSGLISLCFLWLNFPLAAVALMSRERKAELRQLARDTWYHAFHAYTRVGFPLDEIRPLTCEAVGYDHQHPSNAEVNDVSGDFALTLVDSLDGLAVLGDLAAFEEGVRRVIEVVRFDKDIKVQVFEINIRMLGGLLSAHQLATDTKRGFSLPWYTDELLLLATDLGRRLLPAFNATTTGLPYARVNLLRGVPRDENPETCSAGAGSLILEFALLSRLTGDPAFESAARRAFFAVWNRRSDLNLLGNTIDVTTGQWRWPISSTGAGLDSFFEYAAKAHVMLGEEEWGRVWDESYVALRKHVRTGDGFWFRGVNMNSGQPASTIVDSLSAFLPAVQTLVGDLEGAIKAHAVYAFQWLRYGGLPEMYDIAQRAAVSKGYPLRPELIESNLYLYLATKDEWYLELAERFLLDIVSRTRVPCGMAALLDVETGERENKMPSFVTAETLKYLYLTFDEENQFNKDDGNAVWTTEGHFLVVEPRPVPAPGQQRKRRSMTREAQSCEAFDPRGNERTLHPWSTSVRRRTDMEFARYLAGYEPLDVAREVREGRWSESGWCDAPPTEDSDVAILFAPDSTAEILHPSHDQLSQAADGSLRVGKILGLRVSLSKVPNAGALNSAQRVISRVGPYEVPRGRVVTFADPAVALSIPPRRIVHVDLALRFTSELEEGEEEAKKRRMTVPAIAAAFGPSIASSHPVPPQGAFAIGRPSLKLDQPEADDALGCEPFPRSSDGSLPFADSIVLVERGECTFAQKAHIAYLAGARGVIAINSDPLDQSQVAPSVDVDEEKAYKGELVPLVMISHEAGAQLSDYLDSGKGSLEVRMERSEVERELDGRPEAISLGSYVIVNARIDRG